MPLMIIGLILLIGLLVLQIVKLNQERRNINMSTRTNKNGNNAENNEQEKTLYFPTEDVEAEKHKRNIN